ncbi:MAG: aquaporin, partial [Muribaculaceae bacterium]|nr:aquaporin [Muribaculaceae bacterium]
PGATSGMALLAEVLFTFFFILVIFGVTDPKFGFGNFAGLAIGLALGLVNIVGIPVDNCSVNPARSFGPALFSPEAWGDFWIMVVGPLAGAVIAAICWKAVISARAQKETMEEVG